jgi:hypothetical protein
MRNKKFLRERNDWIRTATMLCVGRQKARALNFSKFRIDENTKLRHDSDYSLLVCLYQVVTSALQE